MIIKTEAKTQAIWKKVSKTFQLTYQKQHKAVGEDLSAKVWPCRYVGFSPSAHRIDSGRFHSSLRNSSVGQKCSLETGHLELRPGLLLFVVSLQIPPGQTSELRSSKFCYWGFRFKLNQTSISGQPVSSSTTQCKEPLKYVSWWKQTIFMAYPIVPWRKQTMVWNRCRKSRQGGRVDRTWWVCWTWESIERQCTMV